MLYISEYMQCQIVFENEDIGKIPGHRCQQIFINDSQSVGH